MNPGELRERVQLWADVAGEASVRGPQGPIPQPTLLRTVAAKIEPLSGQEFWSAQQVSSTATHRVTIRFQPDLEVTPQHWLAWNEKRLDVESALPPDARREFVILLCFEHQP